MIPDYQPIPFPLPYWLLQVLIVVGFFTHVLPMNVVLGGSLSAAVFYWIGQADPNGYWRRLSITLAKSLPIFISVAVTQGIVPLLFLQLIYGPLYYTSSIMMAVPWLAVLFLLIPGYYLTYIFKFQHQRLANFSPWLLVIAMLLFATIGFIFSNNMTLMLTPAKWPDAASAMASGMHLNLSEPTLWPRYLHMVVGAFAVTGLAIGCFGLYYKKADEAFSKWLIQTGSSMFLLFTLIEVAVGFWFLFALPPAIVKNFMGGELIGSISFMTAMVLSVLSLIALYLSSRNGHTLVFWIGLVTAALDVLMMVTMRHMLRVYTVQDFLKPELVPVKIQWDLFIAFLILTVGLVFYLTWLIKIALRAYSPIIPWHKEPLMTTETQQTEPCFVCPLTQTKVPRRRFLQVGLGFLGLVWAGVASYPIFRYLGSKPNDSASAKVSSVNLGPVKDFPKNSSQNIQFGSQPALIVRDTAGEFVAFNAVCTHLGCTVQYTPADQHIICACHGGQYDAHTGDNIAGPPPKPLQPLKVSVIQDEIVVSKSLRSRSRIMANQSLSRFRNSRYTVGWMNALV